MVWNKGIHSVGLINMSKWKKDTGLYMDKYFLYRGLGYDHHTASELATKWLRERGMKK